MPVPLEVLGNNAYQETAEGEDQGETDDTLLDEVDQPEEEQSRLDPDHQFWGIKDWLVQHAQVRFAQSHQSVQGEIQNTQWIKVFACPFFHKDPTRYWTCLADTTTTIQGVKRHLWCHHSQPYYCPVCYDTFPLSSKRDAHIKQRACEKREVIRFDGMTPEQKALISTRCRGNSGAAQWRGIWNVLFGRPAGVLEPFLPPVLAWNVKLVAEFWKARGREITEEFLGDMEIGAAACQDGDYSAISGLVNVALKDLVRLTFWRSGLVHSLENLPS